MKIDPQKKYIIIHKPKTTCSTPTYIILQGLGSKEIMSKLLALKDTGTAFLYELGPEIVITEPELAFKNPPVVQDDSRDWTFQGGR